MYLQFIPAPPEVLQELLFRNIHTGSITQVRIQVSTCIILKHMDKPKWTFACKKLFWSITYNYKELYLSLITSRRKRGSKNNGGRDYPSSRNRSRTSIKCGEVNSPVRKPQDRRMDSVNVHVEPYTNDPCCCHTIHQKEAKDSVTLSHCAVLSLPVIDCNWLHYISVPNSTEVGNYYIYIYLSATKH
jgi:hypothetical protein